MDKYISSQSVDLIASVLVFQEYHIKVCESIKIMSLKVLDNCEVIYKYKVLFNSTLIKL